MDHATTHVTSSITFGSTQPWLHHLIQQFLNLYIQNIEKFKNVLNSVLYLGFKPIQYSDPESMGKWPPLVVTYRMTY